MIRFFNDGVGYRLPDKRLTASWLVEVAVFEGIYEGVAEGFSIGELNYVFCPSLLEMNRRFLGHDYDTDVITFDSSALPVLSGEVYIDVQTVRENALRYGEPALREMRRVVLHGLLHLCGQGDKTEAEAAEMRRKEEFYLGRWA